MKESGQTSIHRRKMAGGFTIVELMVTVVVLAILVMLAGPSFRNIIDRYRVKKTAEDIISSIYFARSEAMRTGAAVSIAPISGGNWGQGWQVTDAGGNLLQRSTVPYSMVINASGAALDATNGMPINQWGRNGAVNFTVNVASGNPQTVRCVSSSAGGGVELSAYGSPC